ncbi:MAG: hypothetical protein ACFFD2_09730 [Promethearchaeota archaeon]
MKQSKLTEYFKDIQPKEPPKKILLKSSGVGGIIAEQIDEGKVHLLIEHIGRQKLIAIIAAEVFMKLQAIPVSDLSPKTLKMILPKVSDNNILLLNEAMIKFYREKNKAENMELW